MELTTQQHKVFEQIKAFLDNDASVFILRGYAGTGKTTMVKVIADYIKQSRQLVMMAPTGRAARVLNKKLDMTQLQSTKLFMEKHMFNLKKSKILRTLRLSSYSLYANLGMEVILLLLWMRHQCFVRVRLNMSCLCSVQTI